MPINILSLEQYEAALSESRTQLREAYEQAVATRKAARTVSLVDRESYLYLKQLRELSKKQDERVARLERKVQLLEKHRNLFCYSSEKSIWQRVKGLFCT
jgi:hypothetical protein